MWVYVVLNIQLDASVKDLYLYNILVINVFTVTACSSDIAKILCDNTKEWGEI